MLWPIQAEIDAAYREASLGRPATRPVVELTLPSSVDSTVAPAGKHVRGSVDIIIIIIIIFFIWNDLSCMHAFPAQRHPHARAVLQALSSSSSSSLFWGAHPRPM